MGKVKSKTAGLVNIVMEDIFNGYTVYVSSFGEIHVYKGLKNINVKVRDKVTEGDVIGEEISKSKYEVANTKELFDKVLSYTQ